MTGPPRIESPRPVALVLAVLAYRRQLRRRDRWGRAELLGYQQRALDRLRKQAYTKSSFYRHFHAGKLDQPLTELPVLTKATLMENFDQLVTRSNLRLSDVEDYLSRLRGNELFQ